MNLPSKSKSIFPDRFQRHAPLQRRVLRLQRRADERVEEDVEAVRMYRDDAPRAAKRPPCRVRAEGKLESARDEAALAEKRIYVTSRGAGLRVAVNYFNNTADIDRLLEALICA